MKPEKFTVDPRASYRMTSKDDCQLVTIEIEGSTLHYSDFDHGHSLQIGEIIEETVDMLRFKAEKPPTVWGGEIRLERTNL